MFSSPRRIACSIAMLASFNAIAAGEPEPGMWEISANMSVPSTPGFKQDPVSLRQCLGVSDVRDPGRLLTGIANPGAGNCRFSDKRESPGHSEFSVRCEGTFAISGKGSVDYTPGTMQGKLNISFGGAAAGDAQRVEATSQISAKRIGSC